MENEKTPITLLLGSIAVYKPEDVDSLIDNMNFEQSFFYLLIFFLGYFLQEPEIIYQEIEQKIW